MGLWELGAKRKWAGKDDVSRIDEKSKR